MPETGRPHGLEQSGGVANWLINRSVHLGKASILMRTQMSLWSSQMRCVSQYVEPSVASTITRIVNSPLIWHAAISVFQHEGESSESGSILRKGEQKGPMKVGTKQSST